MAVQAELARSRSTGCDWQTNVLLNLLDGSYARIKIAAKPQQNSDGSVTWTGLFFDLNLELSVTSEGAAEVPHNKGEQQATMAGTVAMNRCCAINPDQYLASLEDSEDLLHGLLHNMSQGVTIQDTTGRIIATNRASADILGLSVAHSSPSTRNDLSCAPSTPPAKI